MTKNTANDEEWLRWIAVQKAVCRIWLEQGNGAAAIAELDRFVASNPPQDLRREAVAFRGSIHEDQDDRDAARADFLSALAIADAYGFERYSIEISLAGISRRTGDLAQLEMWYLRALRSAANDPTISGAGTLLKLLRFRGEKGLTEEELLLVKKVVYQAWSLLRVEGEPDLSDLEGAAMRLMKAGKGPFSANRPPAPRAYSEDSIRETGHEIEGQGHERPSGHD
jgi:tetratricopeptide (TPR) repeat protein